MPVQGVAHGRILREAPGGLQADVQQGQRLAHLIVQLVGDRVKRADYLRQIATHTFQAQNARTNEVRLILDLEAVDVATAQAISCGLIVNELITNSLKHAFAETHTDEVKVSIKPGAEGEVRLSVSDSGAGPPAEFESRRATSLGLQLVSDLARQVGGRLETGAGPGATFTVAFTAARPS